MEVMPQATNETSFFKAPSSRYHFRKKMERMISRLNEIVAMRNKATLEQSAVIRGGKLTGFFRQISCLGSASKGVINWLNSVSL